MSIVYDTCDRIVYIASASNYHLCDHFGTPIPVVYTNVFSSSSFAQNVDIPFLLNFLSNHIDFIQNIIEEEKVVRKNSDTANSTVNLADAAGLSFTAEANAQYMIEGWILYDTSATTVGIKLSANGPSPALVSGIWDVNAAQGTPDGGTFNAYDVTVASSAAPFTTYNLARLHCLLGNGANEGTFIIRFAAETTGTITIKASSLLRYRKV